MTNKRYDVVATGNAIVDILAQTEESFITKHQLQKGAMQLVDEPMARALYKDLKDKKERSGGSAANTVAGIASFGGRAAFIGKVRNDGLGEIFRKDLTAFGVDFVTPPADKGENTGQSVIAVTPDAQRTMSTYLGIAPLLSVDDIDQEIIEASKILFVEGYLWDKPQTIAALQHAIQIAKNADTLVAFTLSDPFCVNRHRDAFWEMVREHCAFVFANELELKALTQKESFEDALADIKASSNTTLIATRSEKGSVICQNEQTIVIDAITNIKVVDTTGAGDLYASGFLYAYCQGKTLEQCGTLGALSAAEVIQHIGGRPEVSLSQLLHAVA